MYGITAFSQSPYSTLGAVSAIFGSAQIQGASTLTANALRERTAAASISATATLTSNGILVRAC